jgi:alpha-beta hydrolase superfamily lysophospholipase
MAREQVQALKEQSAEQVAQRSAVQRAAQERAASERKQRLEQALKELDAIETHREKVKKAGGWNPRKEARASWSDPHARTMKMAAGEFRPAYNVQLASASKFIVGVSVTNEGTDGAQAVPMLEQIERRTGARPKQGLYDSGYSNKDTVEELDKRGVEVFAAGQKHGERDPYEALPQDSQAVAQWRQRMRTDEGKAIYKKRSEHELFNADVRTRQTLDRMLVRGIDKVLAVAVLNVLTYDLLRWISLGTGS